ncbi:hypothetical protein SVA_2025 [Sulfurifustis variabilis]|uniref:Teneurin-like YD-shell domain-containing protein n=1 Tax=Sulfurifustis variabilis TaxID=1675686 RepID=A0A1B4VDQ7_9GAMM|nr:hypothetical protein SVA_2025 [Sulfurifustis variabilis]
MNASGAATYTVPITVPPGTNGMQPSLGLVYHSQGGNGLVGVGWGIAGLSIIHRCGATFELDGFKSGVNFDANDRFCLDGERLVLIGGNEYRTERESLKKIIANGTASNPNSFYLYEPDGRIMEYGTTADSRIEAVGRTDAYIWALNKARDQNGNFLSVSYYEDSVNGEYHATQISYTGNDSAGIAPYSSVQFVYGQRPDVITLYQIGSRVTQTVRLTNIRTFVGTTAVRDYRLSYQPAVSPTTGRSRLEAIRECDASGYCLPPTTFAWQESSDTLSYAGAGTGGHHAYWNTVVDNSTYKGRPFVGDFNGDGKADLMLVYRDPSSPTVSIYHWNSDASGKLAYAGEGNGGAGTGPHWNAVDSSTYKGKPFVGDFNGDGKADLMLVYRDPNSSTVTINHWNSDASGKLAYAGAGTGGHHAYWNTVVDNSTYKGRPFVGDFNGDGKADLMLVYRDPSSPTVSIYHWNSDASGKLAYAGEGNGGAGTGPHWNAVDSSTYKGKPFVGDFNGDGKADLMLVYRDPNSSTVTINHWNSDASGKLAYAGAGTGGHHAYWNTVVDNSTYKGRPFVGDFNGDGKADLMLVYRDPSSPTVSIYHWNSDASGKLAYAGEGNGGAGTGPHWNAVDSSTYKGKPFVGDFNGDGKADLMLVYRDPNSSTVTINHWNSDASGKLAYAGEGSGGAGVGSHWNSVDSSTYRGQVFSDDFDGDGKADLMLVYRDPNSPTVTINHWGGDRQAQDVVSHTRNGLGAENTVVYAAVTDELFHVRDFNSLYPYQDFATHAFVVTSAGESDGNGGFRTTTYRYGGLKRHAIADAILDFRWTEVRGPDELVHVTYYNQNREAGIDGTVSVSETYVGEVRVKYVANTWNQMTNVCGGTRRPGLYSSYEESRELSGALVTTVNTSTTFDSCGHATTTISSFGDGLKKTTNNFYAHNSASWILGQLVRSEITGEAPGQAPQTRVTAYNYDALGRLTQEIVEPDQPSLTLTTTYGYGDPFGNRTSKTVSGYGLTARTEHQAYDAQGRFPVQKTNALGHTISFTYDPGSGAVDSQTDSNGLVTRWDYDGLGRQTGERRPDGTQSTIVYSSYSPGYAIETTTSGSGSAWVYFDILGRETKKVTIGFGDREIHRDRGYDSLGRLQWESHPYFQGEPVHSTEYEYDPLGRIKVATAPGNRQTTTAYNGLVTTVTNPLGQPRTTVRNSQGWTVEATDFAGTVNFKHDPFGNLLTVTDVLGNVTSMQYDLRGRKIGMQDPDMGSWTYGYNALGELTQQIDAKAQSVAISYDVLGRIKTKTAPEGTSTWEYDTATNGIGKLRRVTGWDGFEETYAYDELSRVKLALTSIQGVLYSTRTSYDELGRVATITYPRTGYSIRQVYDENGHLWQVLNASSNSLVWQVDDADAHGRITSEYFGNGIKSQRTYDHEKGTIESIRTGVNADGQVQDQTFTFNAVGNLLSRSDAIEGLNETFVYDDLNRLVTANGAVTKTYQYDAIGNITYKSDTGYYTYGQNGSKPHAVTGVSGSVNATYVYDANGNMVLGGGRAITYTSFNKPYTIRSGAQTITFRYDANGNRLVKASPSSTTMYVGRLYERVNGNAGTEHRHYVYAGNSLVAIRSTDDADVGPTRYIHTSHLDSVDTITDENGNVVERLSFDPFGKRRQPNGQDATGPITSSTTRGFTRHEHDDEVGLINMNARLYDPVLGRFISPDTIVPSSLNSQAFNRYSYVINNPLSLIDPSGHSWLSKGWKRLKKNVKRFTQKVLREVGGIPYVGGLANVGVMTNLSFGAAYGWSTGDWRSVGQAHITGAKLAGSALVGANFSGSMLGQMVGSGINGWLQTGNSEGFFRGFAAGAIPADLGLSDLYLTNPYANVGIGIVRDGLRGYVVGGKEGIKEGIACGQVSNMFGHAWGLASSGFAAPEFRDGAFFYRGGANNFYYAITFGNVITDATPNGALYYNALNTDYEKWLNAHELAHAFSQAPVLGAAYIPAHIMSQWVGGGVVALPFLEYAPFHPLPYDSSPPVRFYSAPFDYLV